MLDKRKNRMSILIVLISIFTHVLSVDIPKVCRFNKIAQSLDCSSQQLIDIPDFNRVFRNDRSIREVNLSNNAITTLNFNRFKCFKRLRKLHLSNNRIKTIRPNAILGRLEVLSLDFNKMTTVPSIELRKLRNLVVLNIRKNRISRIRNNAFFGMDRLREIDLFDGRPIKPKGVRKNLAQYIDVDIGAFRYMRSLKKLALHSYEVRIKNFPDLTGTNTLEEIYIINIDQLMIPKSFCQQQRSLRKLAVGMSTMNLFPTLNKCTQLEEIDFAENHINNIREDAFSGLRHLRKIDFMFPKVYANIHPNAFRHLPSLKFLDLSHYPLGIFPNLEGTYHLEVLKLQSCRIKKIPDDFCSHMSSLEDFDFVRNDVETLPSLSKCHSLKILDLMGNKIDSITSQLKGLTQLEILRLNNNKLKYIPEVLFGTTRRLESLSLQSNLIREIHPQAFSNITNLRSLDVSDNLLKYLPSAGLQSVSRIVAIGNRDMTTFPTQQELPHAKRLTLEYPYHCCFFLKRVQQVHQRYKTRELSTHSKWRVVDKDDVQYMKLHKLIDTKKEKNSSSNLLAGGGNEVDPFFEILQKLNNHTKIFIHKPSDDVQETMKNFFEDEGDGYCTPTPNEFYPCEDLMGKEWLRICVWIVFFLAVFGNTIVLFVLISNFNKSDVPKFLVLNLALADLLLGIYLGFLAFVDIKTLGDFRSHALDWQFSNSCRFAGFLAVFSSELSVFTLTLITIERFLTCNNAMYVEKRLTKNQAMGIMGFGWFFSIVVATLPLIKGDISFNDYTKYSVCLPFETDTLPSRIYLIFILAVNLIAFVIIFFCYAKLYLLIRNSPARNTRDTRAARKMAILVFTDFFCWFPIALVALSAVFDNPFIKDLWVSKVITIFVFPLNACTNPFLYAISMKQFRKDIVATSRKIRDKFTNRREIRKSLLKLPIKGSLTYSTSVRRESSCSFLFSRRHSSKQDNDSKYSKNTPSIQPSLQQSFDEPEEEDYQERLTTV